jgi:hypothetical protein
VLPRLLPNGRALGSYRRLLYVSDRDRKSAFRPKSVQTLCPWRPFHLSLWRSAKRFTKFATFIFLPKSKLSSTFLVLMVRFRPLVVYLPIEIPDVPMMFRGTKRHSPRGSVCVNNVRTIGGRSSRYWCCRSPDCETKLALGLSDIGHGALQFFCTAGDQVSSAYPLFNPARSRQDRLKEGTSEEFQRNKQNDKDLICPRFVWQNAHNHRFGAGAPQNGFVFANRPVAPSVSRAEFVLSGSSCTRAGGVAWLKRIWINQATAHPARSLKIE